MRNNIQIVGNKVYYKMECVAILNELNYSGAFLEFKNTLMKLNDIEETPSSYEAGYEAGYSIGYSDAGGEE